MIGTKKEIYRCILNMYRDLIRFDAIGTTIRAVFVGRHVNVHHINNKDKVMRLHCWENGNPCDDVVVMVNFANQGYNSYTIGFPRAGLWKMRFNSDWQGYSTDFWQSF